MREEGREGWREKGKKGGQKTGLTNLYPKCVLSSFFYHTAFFLPLLVLDESSVGLLPQTQTRKVSLLCVLLMPHVVLVNLD